MKKADPPRMASASVHIVLGALLSAATAADALDPVGGGLGSRTEKPQTNRVEAGEDYPTLDSLFTLYQPYMANISAYEPIYFLVGADPSESKFQFSFKYRFFNATGTLTQRHPWIGGFHFGYTQTSFWDLESGSFPFEDSSYKPELFHLTENLLNYRERTEAVRIGIAFVR